VIAGSLDLAIAAEPIRTVEDKRDCHFLTGRLNGPGIVAAAHGIPGLAE
jgi:hypothetical protein